MTLSDRLPERLQTGYWHYALVILLVLFFLDDVLLAFFGAFLLGGLLGVVVLAAAIYVVGTRTRWGRRRWRNFKEFV